jgi:putative phosphoribosyl transferase
MSTVKESFDAILIPIGEITLEGELAIPVRPAGLVLFAHGSGSSRHSPRNQLVAQILRQSGIGTLLFDLLTRREEQEEASTGHLRFDIQLLSQRLLAATAWCYSNHPELSIGYFGSSTGGAAALVAAALSPVPIAAVVSRGGRPDLAGAFLGTVKAPSLLLVGSRDTEVVEMNRRAAEAMSCARELRLVEGATHLFQEPGALETVARAAAAWFEQHFRSAAS